MAKSHRVERINETLKEILGELVLNQVKDPRIGLVTITSVRVAPDMSVAKVHFSVMGDDRVRKETEKGLISARRYLRKAIATELKMRAAPELRFVYDDSLDRSMAIDRLLRNAAESPGSDAAPPDGSNDTEPADDAKE